MGAIPRLAPANFGRCDNLVDFLVGEYKLIGIQHITLSERFFSISFIRIAD